MSKRTGRSVKLHAPDPLPSTAEKALHTTQNDAVSPISDATQRFARYLRGSDVE